MEIMNHEEQLLLKIKILEEIIADTEKITLLQSSLEQKKAFAESIRNFGKITKTKLYKTNYQKE